MNLREFFKAYNPLITEGGNVSSTSPGWQGEADQEAEEIDLKIHNRDFMVGQIRALLSAQDDDFNAKYGRYIWGPELLKSGKMFSGSSLQFFDIESVSTQDFMNKLKKVKVGDIDTQVDQSIGDQLTEWLKSIIGKKVGNGTFLGFNSSLSSIWRLDNPPVRIQVDYELGPYDTETNSPTEWFAYSHSSHYDDMAAGIKGVFHKYINRALTSGKKSTKYVARVLKKGVKISDEPVTDSDYSFAVTSSQGGGLSKKYIPYVDPATGEPAEKNGIPIMQLVDTKERTYIQDLDKHFELLFGRKRTLADRRLQGSFVGTIQLMNQSLSQEQNVEIANAFLDILFGRGAQMITKDDPERDRDIKFAAVDMMLLGGNGMKPLNVPDAKAIRQKAVDMATEYADAFFAKKGSEKTEITEESGPSYARQGIKHLYNRLPDGRVSTAEMKNAEFLDIAKEIKANNGNLDGFQINLKVDGAGIRFGKDQNGEPFFMTSRVSTPLYRNDVGYFTKFGQEQGQSEEQLARTKNYDNALALITGSKFIEKLPADTIVQAEMMYNPMAEKTKDGLKFVNIPYDPSKLGKQMTLVPFSVKKYSTGTPSPKSDQIKQALVAASDPKIKIITNHLTQQGINVESIIDPVLNLDPKKKENKEAFDQAKQKLSDAIINSPNLKGKDVLGSNIEGIVVNMPSGRLFKVTSQQMKSVMATKNSPAPKKEGPLKTAVVAIGSFAGHRGHEELFQYTVNKAKEVGGDPYLFIGNAVGVDDPIPPAIKVQTWHKLYPAYAKNISSVMQGGSIMQKIKHELINPTPGKPPKYDNIIIMVGGDRKDLPFASALMKAVNKFPGYEHVKVSLEVTPRGTGMSFTKLRNILKDPNATPEQQYALWAQGFDEKKLGKDWIMHLMDVSRKGMGITAAPQEIRESSSDDPGLTKTLAFAKSHYPEYRKNDSRAFMKWTQRSLLHSEETDKLLADKIKKLEQDIAKLEQEKLKNSKVKEETNPLDVTHGSGKELKSTPDYIRSVRRNKQNKTTRANTDQRVKKGYSYYSDKDEWGDLKDSTISESPSLETTVRAITNDIGEPVLQVYATLRHMAKQYYDNNGYLKGFQLVAAGVGKRWYDTFYFNRLGKELHHLVGFVPKHSRQLKDLLSDLPKNFNALSIRLPDVLIAIGQEIKAANLTRNALKWKDENKKFKDFLTSLESEEEFDDQEPAPPSQKNKSIGQQANQAEEIVASVLRNLPSKVAGEIRNSIAKSSNKLAALQQELNMRKIKINEYADSNISNLKTEVSEDMIKRYFSGAMKDTLSDKKDRNKGMKSAISRLSGTNKPL